MSIFILNLVLAVACTWLAWRLFDMREQLQRQQLTDFAFIEGMAGIIDTAECYPASHALQMVQEADAVGRRLALDERSLVSLRLACMLHDCGMLNMSREMIKQQRSLTADEWFLVKMHPLIGELALRRSVPPTEDVPSLIRWHHEKWDGTGYPDRLMGEEIPIAARILSVVDAASAMRAERPYRPSMNDQQIRTELEKQAGLQFDPEVVRARNSVAIEAVPGAEKRA